MSTETPPSSHITPISPTRSTEEIEIRIISHSNLFYWWPVWAVGFLMAFLTWLEGEHMAIVPPGTEARRDWRVEVGKNIEIREGLLLPKASGKKEYHLPPVPPHTQAADLPNPDQPRLLISTNKTFGVIFAITLLLVMIITNVPLRGMWSVVIIILVVLLSIIFALAGWWEAIFEAWHMLHIRINLGGYLFISVPLFAIWLIIFLLFDHQTYMIFTPGQLKVCTEIGGGEKAYDTTGMTIEKQRSDLFRHWILGFGSGDLIVNTAGAHVQHFDLPNVLFIGRKVLQIEDLLREKAVVRGR